jgi:hypothetical protein
MITSRASPGHATGRRHNKLLALVKLPNSSVQVHKELEQIRELPTLRSEASSVEASVFSTQTWTQTSSMIETRSEGEGNDGKGLAGGLGHYTVEREQKTYIWRARGVW